MPIKKEQLEKPTIPKAQEEIRKYLGDHKDELTFYNDTELAENLNLSLPSFNNALYILNRSELVEKYSSQTKGRKAYFGFKEEMPKTEKALKALKPKKPKSKIKS